MSVGVMKECVIRWVCDLDVIDTPSISNPRLFVYYNESMKRNLI